MYQYPATWKVLKPTARRQSIHAPAGYPARHPAFSLIELMLAMTILGLGLVMVATMFPVAWTRARNLAEYTTQENVTQSAEVMMQQMTRVDDDSDNLADTKGSFAGDIIYHPATGLALNTIFLAEANPRVHAMYLENVTVDASPTYRRFVPNRSDASADNDYYAPWLQEAMDQPPQLHLPGVSFLPPEFYRSAFGTSQVSFNQRVYPPLPRREYATVDPAGEFIATDAAWEDALDNTRYAWAVLHRLRRDPIAHEDWVNLGAEYYKEEAGTPREFDVYYVTLRRSRPTLRYAVQDHDPAKIPYPIAKEAGDTPGRGTAVTPAALDPAYDVVVPVPWRVQVWFPDTIQLAANATGVPTEIEVNTDHAGTAAPFLVDFFDVGTPFVDEANGQIYRVTRRRITGPNDDQAYVTLDREIVLEDIDDGFYAKEALINQYGNFTIDMEEQLRTVWVFPPSVEKERAATGVPIFSGRQPVLDIAVRTLKVNP